MAKKNILTYEGLRKLEDELQDLKVVKRREIAQKIKEAREQGDLSENAEYESAREAQSLLEIKIANLQDMIAKAKVLDASMLSTDKVQMLNTVKVENLAAKKVMTFTIVGESEADFTKGRLAATTPIAKALIGHGVGETVEAKVPAGVIKFKILEITV